VIRLATSAALALAALAAAAVPASAQLELTREGVQMLRVTGDGEDDRERALLARRGDEIRFQVDYEVGGADQIGTGHVFTFENAVTGEQVDVATRSFPPEDPGRYNESTNLQIDMDWSPGVYLFRWEINARNPNETSVQITGVESFLVLAG
jgi:hypothetical protein